MSKKTNLIIIFLLFTILSTSGCFRVSRTYKIELIVRHAPSTFWQQVYVGARAAASKYDVELTYLGPERDRMEQIEILEQSIQRKPDAILLVAADFNLIVQPMERAVEAGISVIMVDSAINSDKWVSFVSSDNYALGADLASEVISRVNGPGSVGVISFIEGIYPFVEREKAFLSAMSEAGDLTVLDIVYCDSFVDIAQQLAEDMIRGNPDLVAIAAMNYICADGAARAMESLGRQDIVLVGIDLDLEGVHYMEQGIIDAVIIQNTYLMGYYAVETAMAHLTGGAVERNIFTETRVITIENIFAPENQQLIFPFENLLLN